LPVVFSVVPILFRKTRTRYLFNVEQVYT
jgi:hypothetical protein